MFGVEVRHFALVEARVALDDSRKVEQLYNLFDWHYLLAVFRIPAEHAKVVADGFGHEVLFLIFLDERASVALAHLALPLAFENQRNVRKLRHGGVERLEEFDVFVGVRKVVLTSDDVCDFHADVVNDIHEVEHGSSVRAENREVFFLGALDVSVNGVVEHLRLARNLEKHRAVLVVRAAFFTEEFEVFPVNVGAFALEIRAVVAADIGAFVPIQTEPLHSVFENVEVFHRIALFVGVLYSQHERSARVLGVQPVKERGARAADMEKARRAGGKSYSYFTHFCYVEIFELKRFLPFRQIKFVDAQKRRREVLRSFGNHAPEIGHFHPVERRHFVGRNFEFFRAVALHLVDESEFVARLGAGRNFADFFEPRDVYRKPRFLPHFADCGGIVVFAAIDVSGARCCVDSGVQILAHRAFLQEYFARSPRAPEHQNVRRPVQKPLRVDDRARRVPDDAVGHVHNVETIVRHGYFPDFVFAGA